MSHWTKLSNWEYTRETNGLVYKIRHLWGCWRLFVGVDLVGEYSTAQQAMLAAEEMK